MALHVHLLPTLFDPADLTGGTAVMIDLLRASSTMTTALANGASAVRPFADVDECRNYASSHNSLTGGERGGVRLPDFDFGNSPASYSGKAVAGREICFTTTNGTFALTRMQAAQEILIGCFLNRTVLVEHLRSAEQDIHLVCAGTNGVMTSEDILFAGAVACDYLGDVTLDLPLGTQLAMNLYRRSESCLRDAVRASQGGRNLIRLGFEADIDDVLREDRHPVLPRLVDGVTRI